MHQGHTRAHHLCGYVATRAAGLSFSLRSKSRPPGLLMSPVGAGVEDLPDLPGGLLDLVVAGVEVGEIRIPAPGR